HAFIGSGANVQVGGNIDVSATVDKQSAGVDGPTYIIENATSSTDDLTVNDHGLQTGDVVEYDSSNQNPTSCTSQPAINGLTRTVCGSEVVDGNTETFIVR